MLRSGRLDQGTRNESQAWKNPGRVIMCRIRFRGSGKNVIGKDS
jgi:hypothetical protein